MFELKMSPQRHRTRPCALMAHAAEQLSPTDPTSEAKDRAAHARSPWQPCLGAGTWRPDPPELQHAQWGKEGWRGLGGQGPLLGRVLEM